jgi:pimeloyl-ACP methyl ester carboxylesterase
MGGIMAMFYLQKYGQSQLSGLALIDSAACPDVACLLRQFASAPQYPSFGMLVSPDAQTDFDGIQRFVKLEASGSEFALGPLKPEQALVVETAMITVPQFARVAVQMGLVNANLIFGNLMSTITIPVLIQHGANDPLIDPAVVTTEQALFRNLTVKLYPQGGHIPFILAADEFSRDLSRWMLTVVR